MELTIVTNADQVARGFEVLGTTLPDVTIKDVKAVTETAMKQGVPYHGGSDYDVPERDGQVYRRTGTLGGSTYMESDESSATIYSNAEQHGTVYSSYVIGDEYGAAQAGVHQGRWPVLRGAVDQQLEDLIQELDDDIQRMADEMDQATLAW